MKKLLLPIIILSIVLVGCDSRKRLDSASTEFYGNLGKFKENYRVDNLDKRVSTLEQVCKIAVPYAKVIRDLQVARLNDVQPGKDAPIDKATQEVISVNKDSINGLSKTLMALSQHPDVVCICLANQCCDEVCFSIYETNRYKARFLRFQPPSFIADDPPSYLGLRSDYIVNFLPSGHHVSLESSKIVQYPADPKRPDLSTARFRLRCMIPSSEGDMVISCCWYWPSRLKKMENNLAIDLAGIGSNACFLLTDEEIKQTKPQSTWSVKMKTQESKPVLPRR